jgi:hypothetical protein
MALPIIIPGRDVEGHERNVFLGGEQTIRRYRPVVQFESTVKGAIFLAVAALGGHGSDIITTGLLLLAARF